MIKHVKNLKDTVKAVLQEKPKARDSDYYLTAIVWYHQIPQEERTTKTAASFLKDLSEGKFASPESIRRLRQLIQEKNEDTRGQNYKVRKTKMEQEVRNEINTVCP
jgi:hypothetical protein